MVNLNNKQKSPTLKIAGRVIEHKQNLKQLQENTKSYNIGVTGGQDGEGKWAKQIGTQRYGLQGLKYGGRTNFLDIKCLVNH